MNVTGTNLFSRGSVDFTGNYRCTSGTNDGAIPNALVQGADGICQT